MFELNLVGAGAPKFGRCSLHRPHESRSIGVEGTKLLAARDRKGETVLRSVEQLSRVFVSTLFPGTDQRHTHQHIHACTFTNLVNLRIFARFVRLRVPFLSMR